MAHVNDVAAYILSSMGKMTAMKLQKLVYYSQAWHLVWDSAPLFNDRIEAWANGPVVPTLYDNHRGKFIVEDWSLGNPKTLMKNERETVDAVIAEYGELSPAELSNLTHRELPWRDARAGLAPGERSSIEISHSSMAEYYESLLDA